MSIVLSVSLTPFSYVFISSSKSRNPPFVASIYCLVTHEVRVLAPLGRNNTPTSRIIANWLPLVTIHGAICAGKVPSCVNIHSVSIFVVVHAFDVNFWKLSA